MYAGTDEHRIREGTHGHTFGATGTVMDGKDIAVSWDALHRHSECCRPKQHACFLW